MKVNEVLKFNKNTWLSVDKHCYSIRYPSTQTYYYASLKDALEDLYEERKKARLSEKKCQCLKEIIEKIEEINIETTEEINKALKIYQKNEKKKNKK